MHITSLHALVSLCLATRAVYQCSYFASFCTHFAHFVVFVVAALLWSVAYMLPPLLQDDGTLSLPLFAWLAAYSSSLLCHQVFQGQDLTDRQKNRLLWDLLGEHGRQ